MKVRKTSRLFFIALLLTGIAFLTNAARADEKSTQELAKASQNPVSSLISVPFEFNTNFNNGPEDAVVEVLNIKPVYPVNISKNWNLINRAIVPVIWQGSRVQGEGNAFGLGDITYQGFFSPAKTGKFIWGAGPTLVMPTGANRMTSDKWSAGPSLVGLTMPGHWVLGALFSNVWSLGGLGDAPDVNSGSLQYFINYNMKGGWYLSSAPTITANWKADSGNVWTVPFGGGVGRIMKIGKQHVNLKLAAYYNVEEPDNASDWTLQFTWTFLFPKK